ncbi:hypothetical protein OEB99_16015 [Actinotalea sp. M2MS4P-6]|uniref:hypothetical protein n=1 Tax=Actinotalea sp. M2MS4P-6 TaxID=2983762 RepID=UPI0021E4B68E|nr:hypothetical protein [Actinotalea sp. M2MS4P-6]MCV2395821.1 hypothetical protein [Actinotalea sp. M2MS4P-6]
MSSDADRGMRRRVVVTWVVVLALVAVVVVVGALSGRGTGDAAEPTATGSSTATSSTTDSAEPSAGATDTETAEPEVDPTTEAPDAGDDPTPVEPTIPVDENEQPIPGARPSAPPVDLTDPAAPAQGLRVDLANMESVEGEATIPGEVGGPALRVTVQVTNRTDADVSLTSAVVNLYFGADQRPAVGLLEPGARDFPASVAPGASVTGVWVFNVPLDQRDQVLVEVDLSADDTVVLFSGAVG